MSKGSSCHCLSDRVRNSSAPLTTCLLARRVFWLQWQLVRLSNVSVRSCPLRDYCCLLKGTSILFCDSFIPCQLSNCALLMKPSAFGFIRNKLLDTQIGFPPLFAVLAPLPTARPWASKWHLFSVHNLEGFPVVDAFLPQILLFPPSTLDFLSSPRCHRTVRPRSVMDDLRSSAKSTCFVKGIFWALIISFLRWELLPSFPLFVLWVFCGAFNDSSTWAGMC